MARPEPRCAVLFRNGDAMRLLESYADIQQKVEVAEPGQLYEVMTYTDSPDGKIRATSRSSIELTEVYRVDEITEEFLEQERIAQAQAQAIGALQ
jgi:hypothetical protein